MEEMRKLPKNIRQIGEREDKIKIYMEDYVSTYIHKLKLFDDGRPRVGILLGETGTIEGAPHMFIWGAIEALGVFEAGMPPVFSESVWTGLYEKKDRYFREEAVCGWFFCIRGEDNLSMDFLQRTHRETFMQDQLLFLWQEGENDRFYSMAMDGLRSLKGYSIYYERNEAMQEYLISTNHKKRVDHLPLSSPIGEQTERPEPVVQNFRRIMEKKQNKKKRFRYSYTASLAAVVLGILLIYRIRELPALPVHGSVAVEDTTEAASEEMTEEAGIIEEIPGNVFPTEALPTTEEPETETPPTEVVETTPAAAEPVFYTVKKGDTLSTISEKVYKNSKKVKEICEANNITNPDVLYPGQQLIMP